MRSIYLKSILFGLTIMGLAASLPSALAQTQVFNYSKVWKYNDTGANLGTAWKERTYNDLSWPSGAGVLTVRSDNDYTTPLGEALPAQAISQGARNNTQLSTNALIADVITFYFRTTFDLPGAGSGILLTSSNLVDDGAVIYVNGVEAGRIFMPTTAITSSTLATRANDVNAHGIDVLDLPANNLLPTGNVLAVEVHQGSATSSDILFGMSLSYITIAAPTITLHPVSYMEVEEFDQGITLSVDATGYKPAYQWQKGDGAGGFTNIPVSINATADEKIFQVSSAKASDAGFYRALVSNPAGSRTSTVAEVVVNPNLTGPKLLSATALDGGGVAPFEIELTFSDLLWTFPLATINDNIKTNNYEIREVVSGNLLTVSNVSLSSRQVKLRVSPWNKALDYVVTAKKMLDTANPRNTSLDNQIGLGIETKTVMFPFNNNWYFYQDYIPMEGDWLAQDYDPEENYWSSPQPALFGQNFINWCPEYTNSSGQVIHPPIRTQGALLAVTSYFITEFSPGNVAANAKFTLASIINDGAVFYLNGQEIGRHNMPAGEILPETLAFSTGSACTTNTFGVTNLIANAVNRLQVELHLSGMPNTGDSTYVFGSDLTASVIRSYLLPVVPALEWRTLGNGSTEIFWDTAPGYVLERSGNIQGPWVEVSPMPNPYIISSSGPTTFWRLHQK